MLRRLTASKISSLPARYAIDNKAEYNASSSGFGISTSGPTGGGLAKEKGKAAGTTQSAVAAGNIDIRNTAAQTQDIAELSRDTDNANGRIDKIFDEAKVKDNLAFTQGVTQLATQIMATSRCYRLSVPLRKN